MPGGASVGPCPSSLAPHGASLGRQQKRKGLLAAMDSPSLDTGEGPLAAPGVTGGGSRLFCHLEPMAKPLQRFPTAPQALLSSRGQIPV